MIRPDAMGWAVSAIAAVVGATNASAQSNGPAEELSQTVVVRSSGASSGVVNVNAAAGNDNQQANMGVLASGRAASAVGAAVQHLDQDSGGGDPANALVAPGAFAGSNGWVAINGAAGSQNQQANLAVIAFGIEGQAVADALLSQTRASHQPTGNPGGDSAEPERNVAIGPGAFENSSGLVQISLIGGDRNSSANVFALSVSGAANP